MLISTKRHIPFALMISMLCNKYITKTNKMIQPISNTLNSPSIHSLCSQTKQPHQPISTDYAQLHSQNNPHRHLSYSLMEHILDTKCHLLPIIAHYLIATYMPLAQ